MGLFDSVKKFRGQDYSDLKKKAKTCGQLFVDPEFPPNDKSLSSQAGKYGQVVWKRPKELSERPHLIVGTVARDDVVQGNLGNCWFVAALSCLTSVKPYWNKVIVDYEDQEWNDKKPEGYQGIFRFQFWFQGAWTEVVVDDLLPTVNNQLVFIRSKSGHEFWSALLEKAYAKMYGSYDALDGGRLSDAMEDFTGGVSESIDLVELGIKDKPLNRSQLYERLKKEVDRNTLMGASIPAASEAEMEAQMSNGLVKGHAYGVTAVRIIHLKGSGLFGLFNREELQMIRLRNPWGNKEWTGAFSDGSAEWTKISSSDIKKIGLVKNDDGEFWMTFDDFCDNFQRLDTCMLVNTSIFSLSKTWHEGGAHGSWQRPERAGGCSNNPTFLKNPQYAFDITDDEEEFMIQLTQKGARGPEGSHNKTIGFRILRVEINRQYRVHEDSIHEVIKTKDFTNTRSLFCRKNDVKRGRYVIIPSTFEPNLEGEFFVRVYTSSSNNFMELTKDIPKKHPLNCCGKRPVVVTHVKVVKGAGLRRQDTVGGADPYCLITCEGNKVKTRVVSNSLEPDWGDSALFYRKNPNNPVIIQVWNSNLLRDEFMGEYALTSRSELKQHSLQCSLYGRKKERHTKMPGTLLLSVTQSCDLYSV